MLHAYAPRNPRHNQEELLMYIIHEIPQLDLERTPHDEEQIAWLVDPMSLRYVRSDVREIFSRRKGKPPAELLPPGKLVGYSELRKDAPHNRVGPMNFTRRLFWVEDHDPYDGGGAPIEAVDPLTVAPGVWGWVTDRAWGRSRCGPPPYRRAPKSCG